MYSGARMLLHVLILILHYCKPGVCAVRAAWRAECIAADRQQVKMQLAMPPGHAFSTACTKAYQMLPNGACKRAQR